MSAPERDWPSRQQPLQPLQPQERVLSALVQPDPWDRLRAHTPARIALGRVGASMPTAEVLRFGLAHARARDAVHHPLDSLGLVARFVDAGFREPMVVSSRAGDRRTYLMRPDLGRRLDDASLDGFSKMTQAQATGPESPLQRELVIVVADGLSAIAVEHHAVPLMQAFRELHAAAWADVPIVLALQGRVALGDEIGAALGAKIVVVLIGERPGLSSPDSLGIYFTYAPRVGRMDSERNCISNVRPEGLAYEAAALQLSALVGLAIRRGVTGVGLKDSVLLD